MPQYTKSRKRRPSLPATHFLNNKNKSFRNCPSTTSSIHFTPSKILLLCSFEPNKKHREVERGSSFQTALELLLLRSHYVNKATPLWFDHERTQDILNKEKINAHKLEGHHKECLMRMCSTSSIKCKWIFLAHKTATLCCHVINKEFTHQLPLWAEEAPKLQICAESKFIDSS